MFLLLCKNGMLSNVAFKYVHGKKKIYIYVYKPEKSFNSIKAPDTSSLTDVSWKTSRTSVANENTRLILRWVECRLVSHREVLLQGESSLRCMIINLHEPTVYYSVWAEKWFGTSLLYPFKPSLSLSLSQIPSHVHSLKSFQICTEGSSSSIFSQNLEEENKPWAIGSHSPRAS